MTKEQRPFLKHWEGVVFLVLAAALVMFFLLNFKKILNLAGEKIVFLKNLVEFKRESDFRRQDFSGGGTPEETFNMLVQALKENNITLASQCFVAAKRESWKTILEEYRQQDILLYFIRELEVIENNWKKENVSNPNIAVFSYNERANHQKPNKGSNDEIKEIDRGFIKFEEQLGGFWKIVSF